jgi:hypothetical protein
MKNGICLFCLLGAFVASCSGKKAHSEETPSFAVVRADRMIFDFVVGNQSDSTLMPLDGFLDLLGENIIHIGRTDSADFGNRLRRFYTEPTLLQLYRDEQAQFADIETFSRDVERGLDALIAEFPALVRPTVLIHVSGLNQSVVVTDSLLSLSADKYLGANYPLYVQYLPDYQRQNMRPDMMAPDCLLGFLMANLKFVGNPDMLLDKMLYEGKLRYILSRLLPGRQLWDYVGYSREQYLWCADNEKRIWTLMQENRHLTTPDYMTAIQYLQDAPHTAFLPAAAPGRVGIWLGYRIVSDFMSQHPNTRLSQLMDMTDSEKFLAEAKYKP